MSQHGVMFFRRVMFLAAWVGSGCQFSDLKIGAGRAELLCGNGVIDPGERCDGNCPTVCLADADDNPCTRNAPLGEPCQIRCQATVLGCASGDGCCHVNECNNSLINVDTDCDVVCGDGLVQSPEKCDGNCPTSCDDGNACTVDTQTGSESACSLECTHTPMSASLSGDGCCLSNNANTDTDCLAVCGNTIVEPAESCDANCPSSCDDNNANTLDALVGTDCQRACTYTPIPRTGTCGNGTLDAGELCDGKFICNDTCDGYRKMPLALGDAVTCVITPKGDVQCWGYNEFGQLGLEHASDRYHATSPVALPVGRTANAVVVGRASVCALMDNGRVVCWGSNSKVWEEEHPPSSPPPPTTSAAGLLGIGKPPTGTGAVASVGTAPLQMGDALVLVDFGNVPNVVPVTPIKAVRLAMGGTHACAILDNATVRCWGNNADGRLGQVNTGASAVIGDASGEIANPLTAINFGTGKTPVEIAAGRDHTCAILNDNTVKCWGKNTNNQLGIQSTNSVGDELNEIAGIAGPTLGLGIGITPVSLAAGGAFTCVLLSDGKVKCWGDNRSGQLGVSSTAVPTQIHTPQNVAFGGTLKAKALTAGAAHACALLDDQSVRCWGLNTSRELGNGATTSAAGTLVTPTFGGNHRAMAIAATSVGFHTCAYLDDGTVKCWGLNHVGQLGLGDATVQSSSADAVAVTTTCGNGQLDRFELCDNNWICNDTCDGYDTHPLALGTGYSCSILDDASVKCWGAANLSGQLGLGNNSTTQLNPQILSAVSLGSFSVAHGVSANTSTTCVVVDDNKVRCWGLNTNGQLGLGDKDPRGGATIPPTIPSTYNPVSLQTLVQSVPVPDSVRSVSVGATHVCALAGNGTVKCWGGNVNGELGVAASAMVNVGDGPDEMGRNLLPISVGASRTAVALAAGSNHTCALLDNRSVMCWGRNTEGSLGITSTDGNLSKTAIAIDFTGATVQQIASGNGHACLVLRNTGKLRCWGKNDTCQVGNNPTSCGTNVTSTVPVATSTNEVLAVALGSGFSCAIYDDHTVRCWGNHADNRLGISPTPSAVVKQPSTAVFLGANVLAISAGNAHACAYLVGDIVKCWGKDFPEIATVTLR